MHLKETQQKVRKLQSSPAAGLLRTASTNNRHSNPKKSLGNDRPELLSVRVPIVGEMEEGGKMEKAKAACNSENQNIRRGRNLMQVREPDQGSLPTSLA
jgi:hypothetical protein